MTSATYKDSGVDIDAGNQLIERIKPFAKATARKGLMEELGGFGALFDLKACGYADPILVSSTDGVGTKLAIAQATNIHNTIGIDLVAMCVNDLIVQGAEPLFFLDYFATGKLSVDVAADVIKGIAEGCAASGCALIGGETAEMPSMYTDGKYDLAGFAVGVVERNKMLPKKTLKEGDVVIGLASSGFHSNGFSLVRHVAEKAGLSSDSICPWDKSQTLGRALLAPTRLYVKPLLAVLRSKQGAAINALAHITGGGLLENIPRVLPENLGVSLSPSKWPLPECFNWARITGNIESDEMHRTFNCGIGMVAIVAAESADSIVTALKQAGESAMVIGEVTARADRAVVINT